MSIEIVTEQSEQVLVDMLQRIQESPGDWMSLHINIAPLHKQMLHQEGLSKGGLAKIRKISMQIAQKLHESGLSTFNGKIIVFEDSDVLALFLKESDSLQAVLEKLRSEFTKSGMIQLLAIEEMQEKMAQVIVLAEEKKQAAQEYHMKRRAVEIGENLSAWSGSDPELTEAIQKKRLTRSSICILIIEDDVMVRGLLATMLGNEHQILQAKNAQSGIVSYIDQAPSIVFLDIHMPGLNGHDTLRYLLQIDPQAYVVMLSGDSSTENVLATHMQGAAGFVRKPFTKEKLHEYINKYRDLNTLAILQNLGWKTLENPMKNKQT